MRNPNAGTITFARRASRSQGGPRGVPVDKSAIVHSVARALRAQACSRTWRPCRLGQPRQACRAKGHIQSLTSPTDGPGIRLDSRRPRAAVVTYAVTPPSPVTIHCAARGASPTIPPSRHRQPGCDRRTQGRRARLDRRRPLPAGSGHDDTRGQTAAQLRGPRSC